MRTVYKPWGKEVWLALNEFYCYKRIYINAGHKTSLQYHIKKHETTYIISGKAEVWLENDIGIIEKTIMSEGDYFTVTPGKLHRIIAITDAITQEVSTPEVDDVIRIEDDTNRPDGKILSEHEAPAVLILCAGFGSRMLPFSKEINKVLLPINNKAVLSHIIEKFPIDYEIILSLGYKGEVVQEYCEVFHSDRNITFVYIDDYSSDFTGPGYSALQCKAYLQRPFYFVAGDTIVEEEIPPIHTNWVGVSPTEFSEKYATVSVSGDKVIDFKNKCSDGFDNAFIGLAAIQDYETFWYQLEKHINNSGEIVSAFYDVSVYKDLNAKKFNWFDTGNIDNLLKAKTYFKDTPLSLNKSFNEYTYKVGNTFGKYLSDTHKLQNLKSRWEYIKEITPSDIKFGNNFLSYSWINGNNLYESMDVSIFSQFLNFLHTQFAETEIGSREDLLLFYKEKTKSRMNLFIDKFGERYFTESFVVNNKRLPSMKEIFEKLDMELLFNTPVIKKFHGDLQFANVIYNRYNNSFVYIDWRENFGNSTNYGDLYYDLAKLFGGLILPYDIVKDNENLFVYESKNTVSYEYKVTEYIFNCVRIYKEWITQNKFDMDKISLIVALIFLNMSPLHDEKFSKLLWFKSIELLNDYTIGK